LACHSGFLLAYHLVLVSYGLTTTTIFIITTTTTTTASASCAARLTCEPGQLYRLESNTCAEPACWPYLAHEQDARAHTCPPQLGWRVAFGVIVVLFAVAELVLNCATDRALHALASSAPAIDMPLEWSPSRVNG
jgi:hypothetical protein